MTQTRTTEICVGRYTWIKGMLDKGIPLNCTEIAERLGVSTKTAQRYIVRLKADGYQIKYDCYLRGYVIAGSPFRNTNVAVILREAYLWAICHGIEATWVSRAKSLISSTTKEE